MSRHRALGNDRPETVVLRIDPRSQAARQAGRRRGYVTSVPEDARPPVNYVVLDEGGSPSPFIAHLREQADITRVRRTAVFFRANGAKPV